LQEKVYKNLVFVTMIQYIGVMLMVPWWIIPIVLFVGVFFGIALISICFYGNGDDEFKGRDDNE
jgi:hypothetical protein